MAHRRPQDAGCPMSQPVHVEPAVVAASDAFDLAKAIGVVVEGSTADQAVGLAALLMVCFAVVKQGYPMIDVNLKPFIRDASTYMATYDLPVVRMETAVEADRLGTAIPEVPVASVN